MSKRIFDHKEAQRVDALVIMKENKHVATVRAVYKPSGMAYAELVTFGESNLVQQGRAGGGGYCKLDSILEGFEFYGFTLLDNWQTQLTNAGYTVINAL